jgi:hypothetical protein
MVGPTLGYILVVAGALGLLQVVARVYRRWVHLKLRAAFIKGLQGRRKKGLLQDSPEHTKHWVLVYGATNNVGKGIARVFAKHAYSLILVDSSLDKLQHLQNDMFRVFPGLLPFCPENAGKQCVQIVNINFAIWRDSTSLEEKVREVYNLDGNGSFKEVVAMVNAASLQAGPWQVCEDKMYHEVHFDQVFAYLGNSLLGYSMMLNFLLRLLVFTKEECMVINVLKKEVNPNDRTNLPMRFLRLLFYPMSYHTLLARMNLLHHSLNAYSREMNLKAKRAYPMLHIRELLIDSREDRIITTEELHKRLNILL